MSSEDLYILAAPIIAGIPGTLVGQWWAAFAGLLILVCLRSVRLSKPW